MEPTTASIVVSIIIAAFGGVQAFWASYKVLGNKKNTLQAITKRMRNMKHAGDRKSQALLLAPGRDPDAHIEHLIAWLEDGRLLLQNVVWRVKLRVMLYLIVALGLCAVIPIDFDNVIFKQWTGNLEIYDVGIFVVTAGIPWLQKAVNFLIPERERRFLKQLADLESGYYKLVVEPALDEFNAEFQLFFVQYAAIRREEMQSMKDSFMSRGATSQGSGPAQAAGGASL